MQPKDPLKEYTLSGCIIFVALLLLVAVYVNVNVCVYYNSLLRCHIFIHCGCSLRSRVEQNRKKMFAFARNTHFEHTTKARK